MEYSDKTTLAIQTCQHPLSLLTSRIYFPRCKCPSSTPLWDPTVSQCVRKEECACIGGKTRNGRSNLCDKAVCMKGEVRRHKLPQYMCNMVLNQCHCPTERPVWHKERNECITESDCVWEQPDCSGGKEMMYCANSCGDIPCTTDMYKLERYQMCLESNKDMCIPGCMCPYGTAWHDTRGCVPMDQCKADTDPNRCPGGMTYTDCADPCGLPSCDYYLYEKCKEAMMSRTTVCKPGCRCPPNQVYLNKTCVDWSKCSNTIPTNQTKSCPGDQVWMDPGTTCVNATCATYDPTVVCAAMVLPAKCECPKDKPVFENGRCIAAGDCRKCALTCNGTVECMGVQCSADRPIVFHGYCITKEECPKCSKNCHGEEVCSGIQCPAETPFLSNGYCITAERCQQQNNPCHGGQIWMDPGTVCLNASCSTYDPSSVCNSLVALGGQCECPADKPVFENGECVSADECSPCNEACTGGQVCAPCINTCGDITCDMMLGGRGDDCTLMCESRCMCPESAPVWDGASMQCVQPGVCFTMIP